MTEMSYKPDNRIEHWGLLVYFQSFKKPIYIQRMIVSLFRLLPLVLCSFLVSCKHSTEPEHYFPNGFLGQLETDLDCAIVKPDGTVWSWGGNSTGQLADGTMTPSPEPKRINSLKNITCIDMIEGAAYALDYDGNIWFWGNRLIWLEAPDKDTTVTIPQKVSFVKGAKSLQVISNIIIVLKDDGTVWKLNWDHNSPTRFITPEQIQGISNIAAISGYLCLKKDGTICELPEYSWHEAIDGSLDNNQTFMLKDIKEVVNVTMAYSVVLLKDSTVWAWGRNHGGFLGDGTSKDDPDPKQIQTLKNIVHISANSGRCLALKNDGTVWFWGYIGEDLMPKFQNIPKRIENLDNVKLIYASAANRSLVMKNDNTYWSINVRDMEITKVNIP